MPDRQPPANYDDLHRLIHDRHDGMSRTYQQIARFLTQNPNDVAVMTVNAIGQKCGIHASSFVRYAQALGYGGFKDLQAVFQQRLAKAAPGGHDRIGEREAGGGYQGEKAQLADQVDRDLAAIRGLLSRVSEADLKRAVDLMAGAETIYLLGQLRTSAVINHLHFALTMLGRRVILVDGCGGLADKVAGTIGAGDLLFIASLRYDPSDVVRVAQQAVARGSPVLAMADSTLSPLSKLADVLFAVPEHDHPNVLSLAAPLCLAQSLCLALAARQADAEGRVGPPGVTLP